MSGNKDEQAGGALGRAQTSRFLNLSASRRTAKSQNRRIGFSTASLSDPLSHLLHSLLRASKFR